MWVNYQITKTIAGGVPSTPETPVTLPVFDGMGYFEDGANPQLSDRVLQSNKTIYSYNGNIFNLPIQQDELSDIDLMYQGSIVGDRATFTPTTNSGDVIRYVSYTNPAICDGSVDYLFQDRNDFLFEDANVFEFSNTELIDEILITYSDAQTQSISINTIQENKYTPYRLTFINKFGVLQSLWMFKRSDLKMMVESEQYRSFLYDGTNYDKSQHQYRNLSVSAKQSIALSSGFYPEEHNLVFEELLLSEKVWIDYEGNILPVNLKSKELSYKTRLNDKLIDYKFEFDFAFDKINQVY